MISEDVERRVREAAAGGWTYDGRAQPYVGDLRAVLDELDRGRVPTDTLAAELRETVRQRDKLIARVRELENRANLVAGLAMHDPDLLGQHRAAVFILTGEWPQENQTEG